MQDICEARGRESEWTETIFTDAKTIASPSQVYLKAKGVDGKIRNKKLQRSYSLDMITFPNCQVRCFKRCASLFFKEELTQ
jgi:hypothetical protein